ncbi:MAG TPA: SEC-C metal-binding domain-containing protein [Candidatus Saccharimonadia bacterium]|nr:SEC-C metal-binding domain-containing protein [Candidatus Saccharimonadia bacterium]
MSKVGRNDPCPCGSGKKFKKCHYAEYDSPFSLEDTKLPIVTCSVNDDFQDSGLAVVFVARQHNNGHNLNIVCYLCDIFCLGVKDVSKYPSSCLRTVEALQEHYDLDFIDINYQDARDLILGSVRYAGGLGFQPHHDWEKAKDFIEADQLFDSKRFSYGSDGRPLYVAGPDDDYDYMLSTLRESVGEGNFEYVISPGIGFDSTI